MNLSSHLELLLEAVKHYFNSDEYSFDFSPCSGGINNIVYFADIKSKYGDKTKKYIIRLYNNGNNDQKVIFEHKTLQLLSQISTSFSFQFPRLLEYKDKSGANCTHVLLSNGSRAAMFHLISGKLAQLAHTEKLGKACGETAYSLNLITPLFTKEELLAGPIKPYYDIYRTHHAIDNKKLFFELARSSIYDSIREDLDFLLESMVQLEPVFESYAVNLLIPKQLIHGDLHYDNILCDENGVTGVLDFEFVSNDLRPMELAICLSKYASEEDAIGYFKVFIKGYATSKCKFSDAEINSVPDLIKLRILNNVVYFVSRVYANEDTTLSLISRAKPYRIRLTWITENSDRIIELIREEFQKNYNIIN